MDFADVKNILDGRTTSLLIEILEKSYSGGIEFMPPQDLLMALMGRVEFGIDDRPDLIAKLKELVKANLNYNAKQGKMFRTLFKVHGEHSYFVRYAKGAKHAPPSVVNRSQYKSPLGEPSPKPPKPPKSSVNIYAVLEKLATDELLNAVVFAKETLANRQTELENRQAELEKQMDLIKSLISTPKEESLSC